MRGRNTPGVCWKRRLKIRAGNCSVAALALLSLAMTRQDAGGPRTPITAPTGPHGFPTGWGGFSSLQNPGDRFVLFSFKNGRLRLFPLAERGPGIAPGGIRLELPPPSAAFDEGAIAASAEIVVMRNPKLATVLALARTPDSGSLPVPGELYLRVRKPAAIDGRRTDVPSNPFAARRMKPVPARLFGRREE
jgi:hypothetical protein